MKSREDKYEDRAEEARKLKGTHPLHNAAGNTSSLLPHIYVLHSMTFNPTFAEAQNLLISGGSYHQYNTQLLSNSAEPGMEFRILIANDPL